MVDDDHSNYLIACPKPREAMKQVLRRVAGAAELGGCYLIVKVGRSVVIPAGGCIPWTIDELEECFVVHDSNG